ncbi:YL1-domain-containing protein [Sporormia fimetaria CBS 119925]|uniref:YL1-domain-containing protein n=1 Tax=Sporormia fimetaria CBS 119925 TaxID=1340428 RepID=A0A6A6UZA1_9PLEO|nr:YL1-domain-containing protein [Sporormia fimetaria CBS 119925]
MDHDETSRAPHDAASSTSREDAGDNEAPELMVTARARRSNAGNRMSTLLAQAADEEEWGEEWEEAPNEEEFVGEETNEQDDFNLESSSSSDDSDADDAADDAGEKELRRAERQERTKKRKATNLFAAGAAAIARKKVKLSATTDRQREFAPRPKKKSERASWIPTVEDGPVRTSLRKQTVANKEITLAKLKEKDRRRDDTLAMMKAAEARKAKVELEAMTQEERLAEAARTERINSKSLHKWEAAEEQRAAERQAKLDALKNRQIEGPFIRYWSGPAVWVDDKIRYTGKDAPTIEELDEKLNKEMVASVDREGHDRVGADSSKPAPLATVSTEISSVPNAVQFADAPQSQPTGLYQSHFQGHMQPPQSAPAPPPVGCHAMPYPSTLMFPPPHNGDSFLSGIEQYANDGPAKPEPSQFTHDNAGQLAHHPQQPNMTQSSIPPNPWTHSFPYMQGHTSLSDSSFSHNPGDPASLLRQFQRPIPPPAPPRKKIIRKALRNLIMLVSPSLSSPAVAHKHRSSTSLVKEKDRTALIYINATLFGWDMLDATAQVTSMLNAPRTKRERDSVAKGARKELCAVTNRIARYRDPGTGIPYFDRKAFSVLRGVVSGAFVWSGGLGCYVGGRADAGSGATGVRPAEGVPARFLSMTAPVSTPAKVDGHLKEPQGADVQSDRKDVAAG